MHAAGNKKLLPLEGARCHNHRVADLSHVTIQKKKEKKKKKKKKERLPPKIILSYRTLLSTAETGMTTNLDTFFKGLWVAAFRSTM